MLKKNKAEGVVIGTNFEQNTVTIKLDANCKAQDWQFAQLKKAKVKLAPA